MKKLIFISFILFFGCKKEKTCPATAFLNNYYIAEEVKSWIPYLDYSKVIFTDSTGNEIEFNIFPNKNYYSDVRAFQGALTAYEYCEEQDSYTEYKYQIFKEGITLIPDSNYAYKALLNIISIELEPKLHSEKPTEQKVGDFLVINRSRIWSSGGGDLISHLINERTFPTDNETDIKILDS